MTEEERKILSDADIETESAIERFMGNEELYLKFLMRFESDENYGKLKASIEAQDCQGAFAAAHTLKGVCGNLSVKKMENILKVQVEYLRCGSLEQAKQMMPELAEAYDQAAHAIACLKKPEAE